MSQIIINFDVPEHFVLVRTFVSSARAAEASLAAFNREFFDGNLNISLVVEAPEAGSLKEVLRVVVKGLKVTGKLTVGSYLIIWSFIQFLETDIAKKIIKDETGKLPDVIASEKFQDIKRKLAEKNGMEVSEQGPSISSEICELLAEVLSEATAGSLSMPREQVEKLNISKQAQYELAKAQSELFSAALDEAQIVSVAIESNDGSFPRIPRNQFAHRASIPQKPEEEIDESWVVEITPIIVTALAFKETDSKSGRWRGTLPNKKEIEFTIEDKYFWKMVHSKNIKFVDGTVLNVQLATRFENNRPKEKKVVRVLSAGEDFLGELLATDALDVLLGEWSYTQVKSGNQGDFFKNSSN